MYIYFYFILTFADYISFNIAVRNVEREINGSTAKTPQKFLNKS